MKSSTDTGRVMAVGIFGHYGNENLGDEAIVSAVIQQVRKRAPQAKLYGFSLDPIDTETRHNIESYAIRRIGRKSSSATSAIADTAGFGENVHRDRDQDAGASVLDRFKTFVRGIPIIDPLLRFVYSLPSRTSEFYAEVIFLGCVYKWLKKTDVLIVAGSNQFLDTFGGPWGFPYTLLKWTLIAKLAGCKVCYLSVGANPMTSNLSKVFIRMALKSVPYVSCRDAPSRRIVESISPGTTVNVYPDLAYGLAMQREGAKTVRERVAEKRITVGINPMPVFDHRYWYVSDSDRYESYTTILGQAALQMLDEGYELYFFGTQPKDYNVIDDVIGKMGLSQEECERAGVSIHRMSRVDDLISDLDKADIIIATRFHGVVLSLAIEKPVVAISYYRKTLDLMIESGMADYAIEFNSLDKDELMNKVRLLSKNREEVLTRLRQRIPEYRKAIEYQYNYIFDLLTNTP